MTLDKIIRGPSVALMYTWLSVVAVFAPSTSMALEINGLYSAEVPVKTQTRDERLENYPQALAQVIVKVTGDSDVPELPELQSIVSRAQRLVQRFSYREMPEYGNPVLLEEGYNRLLVVEFDGEALTRALVDAGVALWGRTRPEVLVWLAVEDRDARYLLASGASAELEGYITDASNRRGVPVMLPLMDLDDQQRISYVDIWGNFSQAIIDASERYGADALLVGRLYRPHSGPWQARWSLYEQGGKATHWSSENHVEAEVIGDGIDYLADHLAQRYAQVLSADASDFMEVRVTEVSDLPAYGGVLRYLESLDVVSRVKVVEVRGDEILFRLDVRGEPEGVDRAIALGATLHRIEGIQLSDTQRQAALTYRLMP